jgi:two-component system KDP operon response regulator KdpE
VKGTTVLIVDDEPKIVRFVTTSLKLAGYNLLAAETGRQALALFEDEGPDLIVLDLGLPDIDGFEVLRQIRECSTVPIVILTARDDENDKVQGLRLGADDYLTKPFGNRELQARIAAVLRRVEWSPQPTDQSEYQVGDLFMDLKQRGVWIRDETVHLTPTEYELLRVLVQNAGQVLLHGDLLARVWGPEYRNDLAILRVNVSRLRQKLELNPRSPEYIITVPGVGYIMSPG